MGLFRDKSQEYITWLNLDASVRFRMLVQKKVSSYSPEILQSSKFIDDLFSQRLKVEASKQALIKSIMYLLGTLFLLVNGGDFKIPVFDIKISEIPSLLEIALFMLSLSIAMFSMKFLDSLALDGIIDGVIRSKYGGDELVNHIIKSSKQDASSFWLLFQKNYSFGFIEELTPGRRAHILNIIIRLLSILILLSMLLIPLGYIVYVSLFKMAGSVIGYAISTFAILCVIFSAMILFIQAFSLPHNIKDEKEETP